MGVAIAFGVCLFALGCLAVFWFLDKMEDARTAPSYVWRYCPKCRADLVVGLIGGKQKLHCSKCDFVHWDNPKPKAKTVIPTTSGGIVLVRTKTGLECPGGYLEPYETFEDGAKRETKEETGLVVEVIRLLAVNMAARRNEHEHFFLTKPVGPDQTPVAGDDALEVVIVSQTAVPFEQIKLDAHRRVIKAWLAENGTSGLIVDPPGPANVLPGPHGGKIDNPDCKK